jgi:hypothetical protein
MLSSAYRREGLFDAMTMPFFESIVAASGLSGYNARPAITRACLRAGLDPKNINRSGLKKALPHLADTLRLYVPGEADDRILALRALTE